jgi:hypothetical protein
VVEFTQQGNLLIPQIKKGLREELDSNSEPASSPLGASVVAWVRVQTKLPGLERSTAIGFYQALDGTTRVVILWRDSGISEYKLNSTGEWIKVETDLFSYSGVSGSKTISFYQAPDGTIRAVVLSAFSGAIEHQLTPKGWTRIKTNFPGTWDSAVFTFYQAADKSIRALIARGVGLEEFKLTESGEWKYVGFKNPRLLEPGGAKAIASYKATDGTDRIVILYADTGVIEYKVGPNDNWECVKDSDLPGISDSNAISFYRALDGTTRVVILYPDTGVSEFAAVIKQGRSAKITSSPVTSYNSLSHLSLVTRYSSLPVGTVLNSFGNCPLKRDTLPAGRQASALASEPSLMVSSPVSKANRSRGPPTVFINGVGSVGERVIEKLLTLFPAVKILVHSIDQDNFFIRWRLPNLAKNHQATVLPTDELFARLSKIKPEVIIDTTPAGEGLKNKREIYDRLPYKPYVLFQGGEPENIGLPFVSHLISEQARSYQFFRLPSCNILAMLLVFEPLLQTFGVERIEDLYYKDPAEITDRESRRKVGLLPYNHSLAGLGFEVIVDSHLAPGSFEGLHLHKARVFFKDPVSKAMAKEAYRNYAQSFRLVVLEETEDISERMSSEKLTRGFLVREGYARDREVVIVLLREYQEAPNILYIEYIVPHFNNTLFEIISFIFWAALATGDLEGYKANLKDEATYLAMKSKAEFPARIETKDRKVGISISALSDYVDYFVLWVE